MSDAALIVSSKTFPSSSISEYVEVKFTKTNQLTPTNRIASALKVGFDAP